MRDWKTCKPGASLGQGSGCVATEKTWNDELGGAVPLVTDAIKRRF